MYLNCVRYKQIIYSNYNCHNKNEEVIGKFNANEQVENSGVKR